MSVSSGSTPFPRRVSIALLLLIATLFASNHVAARIAFDHGAGILIGAAVRSGFAFVALTAVVLVQRSNLRIAREVWGWQLLIGLLTVTQTLATYSAIARIPVAMALLVTNVFPLMLVLVTWILSGRTPRLRILMIMFGIMFGLFMVLDIHHKIMGTEPMGSQWLEGVMFSLMAAFSFAMVLWITENKMRDMPTLIRTWYLIGIVFIVILGAVLLGLMPNNMSLPTDITGWVAIVSIGTLYTIAFVLFYLNLQRLDLGRNVSVMNFEPVASLCLGWLLLGQGFNGIQIVGAAIVVSGIVLLANLKG